MNIIVFLSIVNKTEQLNTSLSVVLIKFLLFFFKKPII